jgi:predicted nucleotidyltransferase
MKEDLAAAVIERFTAACREDERVIAACLVGSHARGAADLYSDLDLWLLTTDEAYEDFLAERETFIRRLGEPLFFESFGCAHAVFFILADGAECELTAGRESQRGQLLTGPYQVLLDKRRVLAGVELHRPEPDRTEQHERLRRLISWFWHDLSHFTTAIARGQLWWAYGQLEILRRMCVDLLRLQQDFSSTEEGYDKVDLAVPVEQLAPLLPTYCPMEPEPMLQAALAIVRYFQQVAPPLAHAHGIPYPDRLDRLICDRLAAVGGVSTS